MSLSGLAIQRRPPTNQHILYNNLSPERIPDNIMNTRMQSTDAGVAGTDAPVPVTDVAHGRLQKATKRSTRATTRLNGRSRRECGSKMMIGRGQQLEELSLTKKALC